MDRNSSPTLDAAGLPHDRLITALGPNQDARLKMMEICEEVGRVTGFFVAEFRSRERTQDLADARAVAMYAATQLGIPEAQIARFFHRDPSTVRCARLKIQKRLKETADAEACN